MGHIKNIHGRCLEAVQTDLNGGRLQIWTCSPDRQGQQWAYNSATGQIQNIYGICLDAPGRNTEGSKVHMWECLPDERNQQWLYDEATGQIKSKDGICLDAHQRDADGGDLHMWTCVPGEPNQQWNLGSPSLGTPPTSQSSCHTAKAGEQCYNDVVWAMNAGIYQSPEWYPELSNSSSFVDFQELLHRKGANNGVCPAPCRAALTTPAPSSNSTASCSRLPNVVLPCAQDGCKVLVKRMLGSTCADYCGVSGLACTGAWKNVWRTCSVERAMLCNDSSVDDAMVCECGGSPAATTTPSTTPRRDTTAVATTATTTLAPSPATPSSGTTTTSLPLKTCASVLGTPSGHVWSDTWHTCGDRIAWLQASGDASSEQEAMIEVSLEFTECEPCWPWKKYRKPGDLRRSSKRGIAIQNFLLSPLALANVATIASWGYIWDFSPDLTWPTGGPPLSEWNAAGIRFIPMTWGDHQLTLARQGGMPPGRKVLLGFNEPNFKDQANITPSRAAALWPQLEELAARHGIDYLVSPAVNFNGDHKPLDWLGEFLKECNGCKIDAIAFHSYTCRGQYLKDHIDMYRVFGKPLWLTEFACSEVGRLSVDGQMAYMREAVPLLEHDPDIEMYAWFSYFKDQWKYPSGDLNGDAGLVYTNGTLSPLGKLYGSFSSTSPVDPPPVWVPPPPTTTTTTSSLPSGPSSPPDVCHTAISGESCFSEAMWAMRVGIRTNPSWYPGLSATSSFHDFQRFLHAKGHMEGVCPVPCRTCHTARKGELCYDVVTHAMQQGIQQSPWRYPGLAPSSSFEDFQRFLRATRQDGGTCAWPCSDPGLPAVTPKRCYETPEGCSSVGVNIFGKDGFESLAAMRRAINTLFAKGIRHFRLINVGAWQDAIMQAIDTAAARYGVSDKVSLQLTSFFFESPATCPEMPPWMDYSLTTTAIKLKKLKNIGRLLVQLDTCSSCRTSPLYCTNPTEQAFAQDLRFASTNTAYAVSDFVLSNKSDGYGPAHIVAAHQAFPQNVEFVVPYMNNAQSPMLLVEQVVNTYIAPLRAQGRRFHLEGTIYPFWTSSEKAFQPFPASQVHGFIAAALSLGVDGFVVAETGWPEACPGTDLTKTRPAELQMKCDYMDSVLEEAERLAQASRANGDGELLTYLWKFGASDDGSSCGADGFGLFRRNGSFACSGRLPGWD